MNRVMFGTDTNSRVSENSFEILLKFKFMNILIDYFDIRENLIIYVYTIVLLWKEKLFSFCYYKYFGNEI